MHKDTHCGALSDRDGSFLHLYSTNDLGVRVNGYTALLLILEVVAIVVNAVTKLYGTRVDIRVAIVAVIVTFCETISIIIIQECGFIDNAVTVIVLLVWLLCAPG